MSDLTLFEFAAIGSAVVPAGTVRTTPTIRAFDLSLTCTGVAGNEHGGWAQVIKPPAKLRGHERLAYISGAILDHLIGVDYVAVEGPAFGAKGNAYHQLAGQWWITTHMLWARGVPFAVIPPANVKRFASGKGNANKDLVMLEVARRFPWFTGDNNAADATVICALVADHLGFPMVTMPAAHRTALDTVEWPTFGNVE